MVSVRRLSNPPMITSMTFWNLPGRMFIRRVARKEKRASIAMTNQV